jgi:hypothetical protein
LHLLLDFIRLKASYERHAWQFRPLVVAHEVLARKGRPGAARMWSEAFVQLTRDVAQQHVDELSRLEHRHGIKLRSVADRIGERFVKPLALDRLCALVEPAMDEARSAQLTGVFAQFRQALQSYAAQPVGSGLDVPHWLRRLEMEVQRVYGQRTAIATLAEDLFQTPKLPLTPEELQAQLRAWDEPLWTDGSA